MGGNSKSKHLNITGTGRVQGVGFRLSTRRKAKKLGVTGFVRNEPDGSVYIEAEGTEEQLDNFLKWCRHGPRFARVDDAKVKEGEHKNYSEFDVQR